MQILENYIKKGKEKKVFLFFTLSNANQACGHYRGPLPSGIEKFNK